MTAKKKKTEITLTKNELQWLLYNILKGQALALLAREQASFVLDRALGPVAREHFFNTESTLIAGGTFDALLGLAASGGVGSYEGDSKVGMADAQNGDPMRPLEMDKVTPPRLMKVLEAMLTPGAMVYFAPPRAAMTNKQGGPPRAPSKTRRRQHAA